MRAHHLQWLNLFCALVNQGVHLHFYLRCSDLSLCFHIMQLCASYFDSLLQCATVSWSSSSFLTWYESCLYHCGINIMSSVKASVIGWVQNTHHHHDVIIPCTQNDVIIVNAHIIMTSCVHKASSWRHYCTCTQTLLTSLFRVPGWWAD